MLTADSVFDMLAEEKNDEAALSIAMLSLDEFEKLNNQVDNFFFMAETLKADGEISGAEFAGYEAKYKRMCAALRKYGC